MNIPITLTNKVRTLGRGLSGLGSSISGMINALGPGMSAFAQILDNASIAAAIVRAEDERLKNGAEDGA